MALLPEGKSRGLAAVCKLQASKRYIESLPLVPKDKRSCFTRGERSTVYTAASWSHIRPLEVGCFIDIWKPSIGSFLSQYQLYCPPPHCSHRREEEEGGTGQTLLDATLGMKWKPGNDLCCGQVLHRQQGVSCGIQQVHSLSFTHQQQSKEGVKM